MADFPRDPCIFLYQEEILYIIITTDISAADEEKKKKNRRPYAQTRRGELCLNQKLVGVHRGR